MFSAILMYFLQIVIVAKVETPSNLYNIAVDDISISTKTCKRSPPHSVPGTKLSLACRTSFWLHGLHQRLLVYFEGFVCTKYLHILVSVSIFVYFVQKRLF